MVGRITAPPKDVYTPVPDTGENVRYTVKGMQAASELTLKKEARPGSSSRVQCNRKTRQREPEGGAGERAAREGRGGPEVAARGQTRGRKPGKQVASGNCEAGGDRPPQRLRGDRPPRGCGGDRPPPRGCGGDRHLQALSAAQ